MRNITKSFNEGDNVKLIVPTQGLREVDCVVVKHFEERNEYVLKTIGIKPYYYLVNSGYLAYSNATPDENVSGYMNVTEYLPELKTKAIVARGKTEYDYDIKEIDIDRGRDVTVDIGEPGNREVISGVLPLKFVTVPDRLPLSNIQKWCSIPKIREQIVCEQNEISIESLTRKQLLEKARELGIEGKIATMKGEELIEKIKEAM